MTLENNGTIANDGTLTIEQGGTLTGDGTVKVTGTVRVSPRTSEAGEEVTLTATPDEGHEVDEVTVTDREGDPVDLTEHRDGTYTFEQPRGRVTIAVTFRQVSQGSPLPTCRRATGPMTPSSMSTARD